LCSAAVNAASPVKQLVAFCLVKPSMACQPRSFSLFFVLFFCFCRKKTYSTLLHRRNGGRGGATGSRCEPDRNRFQLTAKIAVHYDEPHTPSSVPSRNSALLSPALDSRTSGIVSPFPSVHTPQARVRARFKFNRHAVSIAVSRTRRTVSSFTYTTRKSSRRVVVAFGWERREHACGG